MIFVMGTQGEMHLMLSEQDVNNMRGGRTTFVDQRQLGGGTFNKVVLSLHKTNDAALELLKSLGKLGADQEIVVPDVGPGEERCEGCDGLISKATMSKGKCLSCWVEAAESYRKRWLEELVRNG